MYVSDFSYFENYQDDAVLYLWNDPRVIQTTRYL